MSHRVCYNVTMKTKKKRIKARVNKDGLMGSASRVHRVKKGKGSFRRRTTDEGKTFTFDMVEA